MFIYFQEEEYLELLFILLSRLMQKARQRVLSTSWLLGSSHVKYCCVAHPISITLESSSFMPWLCGARRFASSLPKVERRQDLKKVTEEDMRYFTSVLESGTSSLDEKGTLSIDPEVLGPMNVDWMKKYQGCSTVALFPKTTAQVSSILKYCNNKKLAVVPQGWLVLSFVHV